MNDWLLNWVDAKKKLKYPMDDEYENYPDLERLQRNHYSKQ